MSLPNRRNLFQESAEEEWDDFFRDEAPSLDEGDMKLTVCEIVETEGEYELRVDLPTEMQIEGARISALIDGQSLVIRMQRAKRKLH